MIDLEDSTANIWEHILLAVNNTIAAYKYELSYDDKKRQKKVTVQRSKTVTWVRPRGFAPQPGRRDQERTHVRFSVRSGPDLVPDRSGMAAAQFLRLHPQERVRRRGLLVARSLPGFRQAERPAPGLHQVHGAGGGAPAGLSDGGISFQSSRALPGLEPRPLGLHGLADRFHARRSELDFARPQHHPARCRFLPELPHAHAGDLPQARSPRHWRHDRALSQPHRRGIERARAEGPRSKTKRTKPTA